jgi:hypothetical protein
MFALPGLPEAITVLNMSKQIFYLANTAITNLGLANLKGLFPAALELLKPSRHYIIQAKTQLRRQVCVWQARTCTTLSPRSAMDRVGYISYLS